MFTSEQFERPSPAVLDSLANFAKPKCPPRPDMPGWMRRYGAGPNPLQHKPTKSDNADASTYLSGSFLWSIILMRDRLFMHARVMAKELLSYDAAINTSKIWRTVGPELQRVFALEALIPKCTLSRLVSDDYFPSLLSHFFRLGLDEKKDEFNEIVSLEFDKLLGINRTPEFGNTHPRSVLSDQYETVISRQYYLFSITRYLAHRVLLHLSLPLQLSPRPRNYLISKPALNNPSFNNTDQAKNPHVGEENWKSRVSIEQMTGTTRAARELEFALKQRDAEPELLERCAAWGRSRDEFEDLVREKKQLQFCSKCLPINRRIPFCSRDCQVRYHKVHKKICGVPLSTALPSPSFRPANPALPYSV
ncbi:hypothetical protein JCM8547_008711 [Rhodosporidiobolus lusitaniae]